MNFRSILIVSALTLAAGGGGFAAGYFLSKKKYLVMADKEIESVKKVYENHFKKPKQENDQISKNYSDPKKPIIAKLSNPVTSGKVDAKTMTPYDKIYSTEEPDSREKIEEVIESQTPRKVKSNNDMVILSPDEFQTSTFEVETLYYFEDKVLTDSDYNVINNVVELIGPEALNTFGRYLNDTVYVRDKSKKVDYEIIWDARKYSTMIKKRGSKIPLSEDEE